MQLESGAKQYAFFWAPQMFWPPMTAAKLELLKQHVDNILSRELHNWSKTHDAEDAKAYERRKMSQDVADGIIKGATVTFREKVLPRPAALVLPGSAELGMSPTGHIFFERLEDLDFLLDVYREFKMHELLLPFQDKGPLPGFLVAISV